MDSKPSEEQGKKPVSKPKKPWQPKSMRYENYFKICLVSSKVLRII